MSSGARIILGLAEGLSHEEISREQGVSLLAIGRWRKRWAATGLEGLSGAGAQADNSGQGHPFGLESGCSTGSWRRSMERARDGAGNRLEQIESCNVCGRLTQSLLIDSRGLNFPRIW